MISNLMPSSGEFSDELVKHGVLTQTVILLVQLSDIQPHIAKVTNFSP
jgi:hypothetical protein